jgi:hypothetical protein
MRADVGGQRHRVAHESADAAVPVRKCMNVVQSMVGGGDGEDSPSFAHAIKRYR